MQGAHVGTVHVVPKAQLWTRCTRQVDAGSKHLRRRIETSRGLQVHIFALRCAQGVVHIGAGIGRCSCTRGDAPVDVILASIGFVDPPLPKPQIVVPQLVALLHPVKLSKFWFWGRFTVAPPVVIVVLWLRLSLKELPSPERSAQASKV
jgi:hypothetical protein